MLVAAIVNEKYLESAKKVLFSPKTVVFCLNSTENNIVLPNKIVPVNPTEKTKDSPEAFRTAVLAFLEHAGYQVFAAVDNPEYTEIYESAGVLFPNEH